MVTEQVFVRRAFWAPEVCTRLRLAIDRGAQTPAEVFEQDFIVKRDVRDALDVDTEPDTVAFVEQALRALMPEVGRHFGVTLSKTEGVGFLRYEAGGHYRPHRDVIPDGPEQYPRRVSVVVFLSAVEGGELRLHPGGNAEPIDLVPVPGTLVAFRSDVLHEVRPVTAGVRDVVVDWYY